MGDILCSAISLPNAYTSSSVGFQKYLSKRMPIVPKGALSDFLDFLVIYPLVGRDPIVRPTSPSR
jgi:hypothetical protein